MRRAPPPPSAKSVVALGLGASALAASVVYGVALFRLRRGPAVGAVRLGLPRAVLADVRISKECGPGSGCVNCTDCGCDDDEVAIGGAGGCPGENRFVNELGLRYRSSNTDRVLNVWRVSCAGAPPAWTRARCARSPNNGVLTLIGEARPPPKPPPP